MPRAKSRLWRSIVILLVLLLAAVARAQEPPAQTTPYTVVFAGPGGDALDEELAEALRQASEVAAEAEEPAPSVALLRFRAREDLDDIRRVLNGRGHFQASVALDVSAPADPETDPGAAAVVRFIVQPGPEFRFAEIAVTTPAGDDLPIDVATLGIESGAPYRARAIIDAQKKLLSGLRRDGFPFPEVAERNVIADHTAETVDVTWVVRTGPLAAFGKTELAGLETVEEEHARSMIPWEEGEPFDASLFEKARANFWASGLFSLVRIEEAGAVEDGRLPITVELDESLHRTVRAGLEYTTDFGPGVILGWQHRNLLGGGERLDLIGSVDTKRRTAEAEYREPRFYEDYEMVLTAGFEQEDFDAYFRRSASVLGRLETSFFEDLYVSLGLGYEQSFIDDDGEEETFGLISTPGSVRWNRADDLLDPTEGYVLSAQLIPYHDVIGEAGSFASYTVGGRTYFPFMDKRLVLAVRALFGQIVGSELGRIPTDKRLFAGGGGSVRGVPFQTAGPLDEDDDPDGGRSKVEGSIELRYRFGESYGLVGFLDAGSSFASAWPDSSDLRYGAGLGFRYHTSFGPLRLDLAAPLNRRPDIDPPVQVYISIGQAF